MTSSFLIGSVSWIVLGSLAALPFSINYILEKPYAISWITVLSFMSISSVVLSLLLTKQDSFWPKDKLFTWSVGILFVAMAYALFFTDPLRNGLGLWISRLLLPIGMGWAMYQLLARHRVKIDTVYWAILWSLVGLLFLGFLQMMQVLPTHDPGRVTAFYPSANGLARYISALLLILLPWLLVTYKKHKWLVLIWLAGVGLLVSTKSYGGTISCIVGMVTILLLLPRSYSKIKQYSVLGLAALIVLAALNPSKLPKWQTTITDSLSSRLEYWDIARGVIGDHFWTGIGIKSWETNYVRLIEQYGPISQGRIPMNWSSPQPHNIYLDGFIKAGVIGFIATLMFLLWPVIAGYRVVQKNKENPYWWVGLGMVGYGVASLVFGLVDDPLWSDDVMPLRFMLYFLLVSVLLSSGRTKES